MKFLLFIALLLTHNAFAQKYFHSFEGKFYDQSIEIKSQTAKELVVEVTFESSERCACEPKETFTLHKTPKGNYAGHPYGEKGNLITAWVSNGNVQRFTVKYDYFGCCSIGEGVYLRKHKK
jgi:hypothetical protein